MGEWNPYKLDEFEWEILKVYLKHGYGMAKLYATTFFQCSYNDETVCMTLEEFAEKAVDIDGVRWIEKEQLKEGAGNGKS